jgi:hypothetical protein
MRRSQPLQQSTFDFCLISDSIIGKVKDADIVCGYRTDHSGVSINLEFRFNNITAQVKAFTEL